MKKKHVVLYLVEFTLLGFGFAFLLLANLAFLFQLGLLGGLLAMYAAIGLFHHNSHHDITIKVVLEYILISVLIFALFIFLNISRI